MVIPLIPLGRNSVRISAGKSTILARISVVYVSPSQRILKQYLHSVHKQFPVHYFVTHVNNHITTHKHL
jgi:hypothetical protein